MNNIEIRQLENVLSIPKNCTIKSQKLNSLTAPGENYGSLMLSLDVELEAEDIVEKIKAVAKFVPPNDFIQTLFNTEVTFRNEIGFYKVIVPALQNFQRERGVQNVINCIPKFLGARVNLEDDSAMKIDNNAVLLFENLKIAKFTTLNRLKSLDLDVAKLVLASLAELHAVALALKLHNPKLFNEIVETYCKTWSPPQKNRDQMLDQVSDVVKQIDELKPFESRIRKSFFNMQKPKTLREPWSTIVHNDCWTNNVMIKLEKEKPVECKLVDFQIIKMEVLTENYDKLIRFYFDKVISILESLNCNLEPFTYASFLDELEHEAIQSQFAHVFFMVFPVLAPEENLKNVAEISPDLFKDSKVTGLRKERFIFLVQEFAKRNWI